MKLGNSPSEKRSQSKAMVPPSRVLYICLKKQLTTKTIHKNKCIISGPFLINNNNKCNIKEIKKGCTLPDYQYKLKKSQEWIIVLHRHQVEINWTSSLTIWLCYLFLWNWLHRLKCYHCSIKSKIWHSFTMLTL